MNQDPKPSIDIESSDEIKESDLENLRSLGTLAEGFIKQILNRKKKQFIDLFDNLDYEEIKDIPVKLKSNNKNDINDAMCSLAKILESANFTVRPSFSGDRQDLINMGVDLRNMTLYSYPLIFNRDDSYDGVEEFIKVYDKFTTPFYHNFL